MVDVDACSRYAEEGLCFDVKEKARKICEIADERRVVIFRGKTEEQVEKMLSKFSNTIKKVISEKYGFECVELIPSLNNNRDHADLYCKSPITGKDITIEVKFGAYTDKAAGMGAIDKIFGTKVFTEALAGEVRDEWKSLVGEEYPDMTNQVNRLAEALNKAANKFNQHMAAQDGALTSEQQAYMEDYLIDNSGSYESRTDNYMRFETSKSGDRFVEVIPIKKGIGVWSVRAVNPIDKTKEKSRISIYVQNKTTNTEIKFVLNNKNNYTLKTRDIKIRSKYMLGSPSWNVWIDRA